VPFLFGGSEMAQNTEKKLGEGRFTSSLSSSGDGRGKAGVEATQADDVHGQFTSLHATEVDANADRHGRRAVMAKQTKIWKEALSIIKSAIEYTGNDTYAVNDINGEVLQRTHELLGKIDESLQRAEVKLAIAEYHMCSGTQGLNYETACELYQEVRSVLEHERLKAWPNSCAKEDADMQRWTRATGMLIKGLFEQAQLKKNTAYDRHGNLEKNGGLERLEDAVVLYRQGEALYMETEYRKYRKNTGIDLKRGLNEAKVAAASLAAAKDQPGEALVPQAACAASSFAAQEGRWENGAKRRKIETHGEREESERAGTGQSMLDGASMFDVSVDLFDTKVRGWKKMLLQEKGWERRAVVGNRKYKYISPDGKTFETMLAAEKYAQGKDDERKGDGEEPSSAGAKSSAAVSPVSEGGCVCATPLFMIRAQVIAFMSQ
jgi:hypothetical protein